jgi:chemotaxis signal transduction protein
MSQAAPSAPDGDARHGLCAFWLGGHCLGLDVGMVGEVVSIQSATPVPMTSDAVRGVFNLRGAPVVVLELAEILQLGERADAHGKVGLILRVGDIVAAAQIDRVEAVIPAGRGEWRPRDPAGDHAAVLGFLDDRLASGRVVTVLDPEVLIGRLEALRYIRDTGD